jgi:hypothetical protein
LSDLAGGFEVTMSAHERQVLAGIEDRLNTLQRFMRDSAIPAADASAETWFGYLDTLKGTVGNFHQWLSFVSCLLAKRYLLEHHEMWPFDVGIKPQGASGLDIDAETAAGARVIAEIKTTVPYLVTKLGSAQRTSVLRDIDKLQRTPAEHKYLFVTNDAAAQAIETGFPGQLGGIELVCLIEGAS